MDTTLSVNSGEKLFTTQVVITASPVELSCLLFPLALSTLGWPRAVGTSSQSTSAATDDC